MTETANTNNNNVAQLRLALEEATAEVETLRKDKSALQQENKELRRRIIELELEGGSQQRGGGQSSNSSSRKNSPPQHRPDTATADEDIVLDDNNNAVSNTEQRKSSRSNKNSTKKKSGDSVESLDLPAPASANSLHALGSKRNSDAANYRNSNKGNNNTHRRQGSSGPLQISSTLLLSETDAHRHDVIDVNAHVSASNGASAASTPEEGNTPRHGDGDGQESQFVGPDTKFCDSLEGSPELRGESPKKSKSGGSNKNNTSSSSKAAINLDDDEDDTAARQQRMLEHSNRQNTRRDLTDERHGRLSLEHDVHRHDVVDVNAHVSASNGASAQTSPQLTPLDGSTPQSRSLDQSQSQIPDSALNSGAEAAAAEAGDEKKERNSSKAKQHDQQHAAIKVDQSEYFLLNPGDVAATQTYVDGAEVAAAAVQADDENKKNSKSNNNDEDQRRNDSPPSPNHGFGMYSSSAAATAAATMDAVSGYTSGYASEAYTANYSDCGSGSSPPLRTSLAGATGGQKLSPAGSSGSGTGGIGITNTANNNFTTTTAAAANGSGAALSSLYSPASSNAGFSPASLSLRLRAASLMGGAPGQLVHTMSLAASESGASILETQSTSSFLPELARLAAVPAIPTTVPVALVNGKTQTPVARVSHVAVTASYTDIVETMRRHGVEVASPVRGMSPSPQWRTSKQQHRDVTMLSLSAAADSPDGASAVRKNGENDDDNGDQQQQQQQRASSPSPPKVIRVAAADVAQQHLDRLQGLLDHVSMVTVRCVESTEPRRG